MWSMASTFSRSGPMSFNFQEVLKYATKVDAIFAVQFQVMNRNTWDAMPAEFQDAFWAVRCGGR